DIARLQVEALAVSVPVGPLLSRPDFIMSRRHHQVVDAVGVGADSPTRGWPFDQEFGATGRRHVLEALEHMADETAARFGPAVSQEPEFQLSVFQRLRTAAVSPLYDRKEAAESEWSDPFDEVTATTVFGLERVSQHNHRGRIPGSAGKTPLHRCDGPERARAKGRGTDVDDAGDEVDVPRGASAIKERRTGAVVHGRPPWQLQRRNER